LGVIARQQGRGLTEIAERAGVPVLAASSLTAALDVDWDDPAARDQALVTVLAALQAVEASAAGHDAAAEPLRVARQVRDQDVELIATAPPR
jgi:hypothetical protein